MKSLKLVAAIILMLSCVSLSHAGIYTLVNSSGQAVRAEVVVQIWDTAMVMHTQFRLSGPRLVFDGYQYPGKGPYTMVIFIGNREVWRGRVNKDDGQGDDNGVIISI